MLLFSGNYMFLGCYCLQQKCQAQHGRHCPADWHHSYEYAARKHAVHKFVWSVWFTGCAQVILLVLYIQSNSTRWHVHQSVCSFVVIACPGVIDDLMRMLSAVSNQFWQVHSCLQTCTRWFMVQRARTVRDCWPSSATQQLSSHVGCCVAWLGLQQLHTCSSRCFFCSAC